MWTSEPHLHLSLSLAVGTALASHACRAGESGPSPADVADSGTGPGAVHRLEHLAAMVLADAGHGPIDVGEGHPELAGRETRKVHRYPAGTFFLQAGAGANHGPPLASRGAARACARALAFRAGLQGGRGENPEDKDQHPREEHSTEDQKSDGPPVALVTLHGGPLRGWTSRGGPPPRPTNNAIQSATRAGV